jgi:hypothetical protein
MFALFNTLDSACGLLPGAVRVGLYGLITGALTMIIYWRISPQSRIAALKKDMSQAQRAIREYVGTNLNEICRLSWRAVSPAARQVLLVAGPTLVAVVPVVLLMAWLESSYSYRLPHAGDMVTITTTQASTLTVRPLRWVPTEIVSQILPQEQYVVRWPSEGETARLIDVTSERDLLLLPLERPIRTIGPPRWWHMLLDGGGGADLPAGAPLSSIVIDLPARKIWAIGPEWLRSWHATFMLGLTAGALGAKFRFKIA